MANGAKAQLHVAEELVGEDVRATQVCPHLPPQQGVDVAWQPSQPHWVEGSAPPWPRHHTRHTPVALPQVCYKGESVRWITLVSYGNYIYISRR